MEQHSLSESIWRRGWQDTKTAWTSWQFFVLDAVVAVVIGGVFAWYWGLVLVIFGMLCVWLGATASAPIKQRNEARAEIARMVDEARKRAMEVVAKEEQRIVTLGIIGGIEHDIFRGKQLLEKLKHSNALDIYLKGEYDRWYSLVGECLQRDLNSEYAPWVNAAYTDSKATLDDLVKACDRGVNQLVELQRRLTN